MGSVNFQLRGLFTMRARLTILFSLLILSGGLLYAQDDPVPLGCEADSVITRVNTLIQDYNEAQSNRPDLVDAALPAVQELESELSLILANCVEDFAATEDISATLQAQATPIAATADALLDAQMTMSAATVQAQAAGVSATLAAQEATLQANAEATIEAVNAGVELSVQGTLDAIEAEQLAAAAQATEQAIAAEAALPGRSRENAVLLGEAVVIEDDLGSVVIERVLRPADGRDVPILQGLLPVVGNEFLLAWTTFTCLQEVCPPAEELDFVAIGRSQTVYPLFRTDDGEPYPQQLAGQTVEGVSVSGWLLFEVDREDGGLLVVAGDEEPGYFLLTAFPADSRTVSVASRDLVNLRECPDTECDILAQLRNGTELLVNSEQDGWFEVRTQDGLDGFVFAELVREN